jgi:hypothetical protein
MQHCKHLLTRTKGSSSSPLSFITPTPSHCLSLALVFSVLINNGAFINLSPRTCMLFCHHEHGADGPAPHRNSVSGRQGAHDYAQGDAGQVNATVFSVFSTAFTLLKDEQVLVNPIIFLVHHPHRPGHPVENLCAVNRPFSVFTLPIAGTLSTDIPASHL